MPHYPIPNGALLREGVPLPDIQPHSITLYPGMGRLTGSCFIDVMNRSHTITAELLVPPAKTEGSIDGVVIYQTGMAGGWALYVKHGKPTYVYSAVGVEAYKVTAADPLSAGKHEVRLEFAYADGGVSGGPSGGGTATLFVDGAKAGATKVRRTQILAFPLDRAIGLKEPRETNSIVTTEYMVRDFAFGGEIRWVRIDVRLDGSDPTDSRRRSHVVTKQ